MGRNALLATAFGLASTAYSQLAQTCPESDVCYQLNVPTDTASSGNGDIFFQLSAPTSYEWVALGQGSSMSGSQMFVMYTSADGTNVTVSPRLGTGHQMPQYNSDAQITVLEGSGVTDGMMTANVKCSDCGSWSGGDMDFSSSSTSWIYAVKSGSALDTDELDASISQHNSARSFTWELAAATGGDGTDPFAASSGSSSGSGTATGSGSAATGSVACTPIASGTSGGSGGSGSASKTLASPSGAGCPTAWPTEFSNGNWPTAQPTWASSCFDDGQGPWPTNAPWQDDSGNNWWDGNNGNNKRQADNSCPEGFEPDLSAVGNGNLGGNGGNGGASSGVNFQNNGNPFGGALGPNGMTILIAHGVIASLCFVLLFPIGGILIRLFNFPGLVWVHAGIQAVTYLLYIVAFGLGIYMASTIQYLDKAHAVIGIVLFIVLLAQPILGLLHHKMFKKYSARTLWSHAHIWLGRAIIPLGIINGGLGLALANNASTGQLAAYAVIAAIMGIAYIVAIVIGERRRKRAAASRPPTYERSQKAMQMQDMSGGSSPVAGGSDENVNDAGNGNREFYSSRPKQHPSRYQGA